MPDHGGHAHRQQMLVRHLGQREQAGACAPGQNDTLHIHTSTSEKAPSLMSVAFSHSSGTSVKSSHAVVLVHYGDPAATKRCLRSLALHEPSPHMAIVVDHGPGPDLALALEGVHPALRILSAHENPGFGAGCNLGAEEAFRQGAECVWFLNNDAVIETPMLEELAALARSHPEVAFWGHTQRERGRSIGPDRHPAWYALPQPVFPLPPLGCRYLTARESLSGASLFVSRAQWERIGPWPSDYFLYYEDAAYCHRAHCLGLPMALLDRTISHERGTTTGRRSPLTVFYGVRNRLFLHREIQPQKGLARLLMGVDLLQKRFFQGRWRLLKPTLDGLLAAARNRRGRDPRY
ncbi:MAG TPA: glycosyltransferase family 2 protein [Holophagaceae bacterium]|nr:glycosyltransferase family 2 protein [Geothrix sp.]HJW33916.1 glycosyltransferase family 2 protein [Holophagaceae bacterium]